jgi:UDP-N-acetylmuramoylalanine-D-glutamate ligase
MATRRWSLNPQDADYQTTEAVGAATVTKIIELTVDFDALTAAGITGTQGKTAVLDSLEKMHAYINKGLWPPA